MSSIDRKSLRRPESGSHWIPVYLGMSRIKILIAAPWPMTVFSVVWSVTAVSILPARIDAQVPGLPFDSRQFTFDVLSDNHLRLTGEVELDGPDGAWQFYADQVDIFTDDSLLVAVGNVVYVADGARLAADRAEVNTEDLTGTFYNAAGAVSLAEQEDIERSMFGTQEPDMYFYGEEIEKRGPRTYHLAKGGFTSCIQPTPRWEMKSTAFTINLDEYVFMRNTVLQVKGVPVFYLPAMYFPVQEDGRATGFLMPMYGASTYRGTSLSNAFFWAMGRSQDATFFHDWFTQTGQGQGAEYRYVQGPGSQGFMRTYFLNEKEAEIGGNRLPARRSYEVRGDARQQITPAITARGNVNFFSDVTVQQTYHQNVFDASNRQRSLSGNVAGTWGIYQLSGTFDANETFFGNRSATLWGGGPRVSFGQGQKEVPGTPFYYSFNSEYVRLLRRTTFMPGTEEEDRVNSGLHRFDVNPVLQIPFTKWPFLTINSSAGFRSTYWTERIAVNPDGSRGDQIPGTIGRNIVELQSQITGPSFVKIWDTPGSGYSERMKHVIEPWVSFQRVSAVDQFDEIVQLEGIDSIVGGTTRIQYGVNNRFYARGASLGNVAREILSIAVSQSYYTNARAAQFDRRYSTSFNRTGNNNYSPVSILVRTDLNESVSAQVRTEIDSRFKAVRQITADGRLDVAEWLSTTNGWSQRRFIEGLPGFNNRDRLDHYINSYTSLRNTSNTIGGAYRFNYDIHGGRFLQQRLLVYYNAQCCGVSVEYQTFNFAGLGSRVPIPEDRRFNLSFTLAGLGTFANVLGGFGAGQGP